MDRESFAASRTAKCQSDRTQTDTAHLVILFK
jgi:hypothetical protein